MSFDTIVSLLQQIAQQNYDIQEMKKTLEDIQQNLEDSKNGTSSDDSSDDDAVDEGEDITQDVDSGRLEMMLNRLPQRMLILQKIQVQIPTRPRIQILPMTAEIIIFRKQQVMEQTQEQTNPVKVQMKRQTIQKIL